MTSYYKIQQIVFQEVDKRIIEMMQNNTTININSLLLELTSAYAISPKAIEKRIDMNIESKKDFLTIKNGEVVLIEY